MAEAARSGALALDGPVTLSTLMAVQERIGRLGSGAAVDLSGVTALDTAGAWALAGRTGLRVLGADAAQMLLLQTVRAALPAPPAAAPVKARHPAGDLLGGIGAAVTGAVMAAVESLSFLGLVMARLAATLARPGRLRVTALVHQMEAVGLNAVPIVALMGFLIGIVLAFQGASQLQQFGAEVWVTCPRGQLGNVDQSAPYRSAHPMPRPRCPPLPGLGSTRD